MRTRARLLSGARWSLVLVAVGAILFIGFLAAYAQGDEEGTVSTPASQAPYVPLQVQPVNVNIRQINPSKFPVIELYVQVTDQDGNTISGLNASNFLATEQSNLESQPTTETISVAPITGQGGITVAIAFDTSGSMDGQPIIDARDAANIFIDTLTTLDRAALLSFGSPATFHDPPGFTSDKDTLHGIVNSFVAGGWTALYGAIYRAVTEINKEVGVKAVVVFTDGHSEDDTHTKEQAISLAKSSGVPVYTIALGTRYYEDILQEIAAETGGYYTFAPTAADLEQIYNDIAQAIRDQYLVTYSTHNPNYDGTTRTVEVTVTVGANSDSDTATYTVTEPPEISLTQDTLNLMAQAQYAAQTLTIGAIITDDVAVTQAKLFYRTSGSGDIYKEVSMTSSSDLYTADIPGSDVATPGVDFYITASDGTLTSSEPQNNPATYPHQISILPNEAPVIDHTPVTTATVGTNIPISAIVTDTTDYVDSAKLFYRTTGYVLYDSKDMVSSSDTYVATIPGSKVTLAGIDYYIIASDNHSVRTYDGTDVAPHHIDVTSGPINHPPDTKIETADIDSANGTAKFTWSGSDDSTPPAQLVYEHRLLNPDSPLYDWSDWSSSTTATYPRAPDTRLPDGTYRFQVKAKDADGAIQPDSATWEFTIGGVLKCVIHLRPQGVEASIGVISDFETFDIYVGASTGDIKQVRFSSDEALDEIATGEWTEWYDWNSNALFSPWDAAAKTMIWSFATGGNKEVCAEIRSDSGGATSRAYAYIKVEPLEWRKHATLGDVLYDPTFLGERAGHVGLYVGGGRVIEALKVGVRETSIATWDERTEAMLLDVSATFEVREEAVDFARGQLGKPYDFNWTQKNPDYNEPRWYCSELVWAAYFNQGVNLEYTPDQWAVTPSEIVMSPLVEIVGHHGEGEPGVAFEIRAECPVTLVLVDPDGLKISCDTNDIPDALYIVDDFNNDGEREISILLSVAKAGEYLIDVQPLENAALSDTYTVVLLDHRNGTRIVLADEVAIQNIPSSSYRVTVTQGGVAPANAPPDVSLTAPTSAEAISSFPYEIRWQATDPDNPASSLSIDLFYSTDGETTWTSISSNEANDGVYDWDINALHGGEYWLKVVAEDPDGGTSEATVGPFTISTFTGNIIIAPNPVTGAGAVFFYALPTGATTAKLMIFNVIGRLLFETTLDVDSTRFPNAGTWNPMNQDGIPLANGPYVYILIADGKVIGQGKMVIQR
ncbi:VWA domain-containing protein [Candidatus Bipolaricaulota bacterium]|nr:VWA domain-containing protein [Candidatus Bipolaricaulota bacterium]